MTDEQAKDMAENIRIALVVAVSKNGVIGVDGGLAWKISDDLKWFKKVTMDKPMVMGRKTFQSIGKALPGRDNIIITRSIDFDAEGIFLTRNVEAALALGHECAARREVGEVSVIGGGEIYAQTLALANRIYLTRVDVEIEGDVTFPALDSREWSELSQGTAQKNERNQYDCEFFILDRHPL